MSIILDEPDGLPLKGRDRPQRLKALRAWLAQRDRDRRAEATREIVSTLYPKPRRKPESAPNQPSL